MSTVPVLLGPLQHSEIQARPTEEFKNTSGAPPDLCIWSNPDSTAKMVGALWGISWCA